MELSGQEKFDQLRRQFPFLSFEGYDASIDHDGLKVEYRFDLSGIYQFRPSFFLPSKPFMRKKFDSSVLQSEGIRHLLLHIGLIELISYWKAACPPEIILKDIALSNEQTAFWKKIYFQGLGEFFYTNGIKTEMDSFVNIRSGSTIFPKSHFQLEDSILVPIGGGKDSVVSLELLKKQFDVRPFILNPRGASLETCFKAGFTNLTITEIQRKIDPLLLKLNAEGFLNGHTPFSALLAFYTLLVAAFTGQKHIALSNESSANEPTVVGTEVNHQYSKSFAFESDFRRYVRQYISEDFNYFSFLRPLGELQIAMLFSRNVKYYPVFKSCNVGSKTDSWCGSCPKCLFAWIIMCPFIPQDELTHIFGKNLFEDASLIPYLKELTGLEDVKPFECVGTIDEVNAALQLFIRQHGKEKWPLLIDYYSNSTAYSAYSAFPVEPLLENFEEHHFLEDRFLDMLKQSIAWKN